MHADTRSGDPLTIAAYIGRSDQTLESIVRYAMAYAEVTESDFAAFQNAIRDGRIETPQQK